MKQNTSWQLWSAMVPMYVYMSLTHNLPNGNKAVTLHLIVFTSAAFQLNILFMIYPFYM